MFRSGRCGTLFKVGLPVWRATGLIEDYAHYSRAKRLVQSDNADLSSDIRHILTVRELICWIRCLLAASVTPNDTNARIIGKSVFGNRSEQPAE
jgi:hypothetical protein